MSLVADREVQRLADALEVVDAALARADAPAGKRLPISEDEYVALALAEPAILDEARAERYARWRYRALLGGDVSGL